MGAGEAYFSPAPMSFSDPELSRIYDQGSMMNIHAFQLYSGAISCGIFIASNLPMLRKAFQTRDLKSYSLGQILLGNLGNCIYWIYLISLPLGPAWLIHGFFTLSSLLMLVGYLYYEAGWARHLWRPWNHRPNRRIRA